ncbi:MAG: type II toxin-antitoxin system VapC family toxin [Desulfobacterales bacterium]
MIPAYLFDSHALLSFFQNEAGAEIVADVLKEALRQNTNTLISVINLGEIIYLTKRRFGEEKKLEILGRIHQLGLQVLPAPDSLVYQAAEFKAEYPIAYADCFALACAIEHSAVLVTGDPEFKLVEHLVTIQWIR